MMCSVAWEKITYNAYIAATQLFTMITITVRYKVKWLLKTNPKYGWTGCGKLFNLTNNREIKKTIKGLTPGYWIGREFISLDKLRSQIEIIPKKQLCPF